MGDGGVGKGGRREGLGLARFPPLKSRQVQGSVQYIQQIGWAHTAEMPSPCPVCLALTSAPSTPCPRSACRQGYDMPCSRAGLQIASGPAGTTDLTVKASLRLAKVLSASLCCRIQRGWHQHYLLPHQISAGQGCGFARAGPPEQPQNRREAAHPWCGRASQGAR